MRLYAFLLFALFALAARAATIPENVAASEKKINVVPENTDKAPENVTIEQELIDQSNTINDVDNKLRAKPEDIPVEVIVENVALKAADQQDESEEIVRPPVDLRNPGLPQRQEHETQNPEFYAAEQQIVQIYKQNLNDAQASLKQGLKSVSDNVQSMLQNNEQINMIQQSIQTLREGFIAQVNKLNGTVQRYLNADSTNEVSPAVQQTKANIQGLETGLKDLKNDFDRGLQTLTDGVQVFASLRADNEKPEENKPSAGVTTAPANPAPAGPGNMMINILNNLQNRVQSGFANLTSSFSDIMTQAQTQVGSIFQGQSSTVAPAGAPPAGVQSDTPATQAPWNNWVQSNPFAPMFTQLLNLFGNFPGAQTPQAAQPTKPSNTETTDTQQKPNEESKPDQQAAQPAPEAEKVSTTVGPIRQILQNNPISQGIASAVQRLQNINNPDKPRDTEKEKAGEEPAMVDDKVKGHPPAVGSNINSDGSGIGEKEPVKEVQNEALPEAQEPMKQEEVKEQKADEVVDKTE